MRLTMTMFLTLDGVMQAPGGPDEDRSDGFQYGGWQAPFADADMGSWEVESILNADAFLLGRKTYEIFARYWPNMSHEGNPIAEALNTRPKYVVSTTLTEASWNPTTIIKGDLAEEIGRLKAQPGRKLQMYGSANLALSLMKHNLIDEYNLWYHPVVLGQGRRLFADGVTPATLRHLDTRTTSSGIIVARYEPAGPVQTGTLT